MVYCGLRATEYLESGEVFKLSLPIKVADDTNHPRLSMVGDFMRGSRRNRINASIDIILFMLGILVLGMTLGLARFTNWPTLRVGVAFMIFKTVKTSLHFSDLPFQSWRSNLVGTWVIIF